MIGFGCYNFVFFGDMVIYLYVYSFVFLYFGGCFPLYLGLVSYVLVVEFLH